jgi:hypothetical protein
MLVYLFLFTLISSVSMAADSPVMFDLETDNATLELAGMLRIEPSSKKHQLYFRTSTDGATIKGVYCNNDHLFYCGFTVIGPAYLIIELKSIVRTHNVPENCSSLCLAFRQDDIIRKTVSLRKNDDVELETRFRTETHEAETNISLSFEAFWGECLWSIIAFPMKSKDDGFTFNVKKVVSAI